MTAYCDARREMAALLTYARMERRSAALRTCVERLAVAGSLGGAA